MKDLFYLIALSVSLLLCIKYSTPAQTVYPLEIDFTRGVTIGPHKGTGLVSPYLSDWSGEGRASLTVRWNPQWDPRLNPLGSVNLVFLGELRDNTGNLVAQSNNTVRSPFQIRIFSSAGNERHEFTNRQLNFILSASNEGGLVPISPITADTRLPAGVYRLIVTLWDALSGRQLSTPYPQEIEIPRSEDDLSLTVRVNENSPYFSDWARNPNSADITIGNRWQRAMDVYMETRITDATGNMVETNPYAGRSLPPIRIPATPSSTLNARDIPFFSPSLTPEQRDGFFRFRSDVETYRRAGRFPEGREYRLCIQLRNYVSGIIHGEYQCSDPFRIDYPLAPELLSPDNGNTTQRILTFRWSHDLNSQIALTTRYRIQIKEVPPTGNVTPDLFNTFDATRDIQQDNISGLFYPFPTPNPRLVAGRRYAWRVQAYSLPGSGPAIAFQNSGWSNVWTFYYESDPPVAAPVLESPENNSTTSLPQTFQWSDVRLHNERYAQYWIHVREIGREDVVSRALFNASHSALRIENSDVRLPQGDLGISFQSGRRYAWYVEAFDPADPRQDPQSHGRSEIWTFMAGASAGGTDARNEAILLLYPPNEPLNHLADERPPFVVDPPTTDRSVRRRYRLIIHEVNPSGIPQGFPEIFEYTGTLPLTGPILFLNRYGSGGSAPAGQPVIHDRGWTPRPGKSYRWTLEIQPEDGGTARRNYSVFHAAPRAVIRNPTQDNSDLFFAVTQVGRGYSQRIRYFVNRPTRVGTGFAPGDIPAPVEGSPHYVMNPVIRTDDGIDPTIRFQDHRILTFTSDPLLAEDSLEYPQLPEGVYRLVINTKYGNEIVASSDERRFYVRSGNPCDGCICVGAISPVTPERTETLFPYAVPPRFTIGFRPTINPSAVTKGTIKVWLRTGTDATEAIMRREPTFTGEFTDAISRGSSAGLTQLDVTPINSRGNQMQLQRESHYIWQVEVEFDPTRIRADGSTPCPERTALTAVSIPAFFSTMREERPRPNCNELSRNTTPAPSLEAIGREVQIGGYTLVIGSETTTWLGNGRISGNGRVRARNGGSTWAVEFTNLLVNSEGIVIDGQVKAMTRRDMPSQASEVMSVLQQSGVLNSRQVQSITAMWHQGGGTILEALTGDKMVPFGIQIDSLMTGVSQMGTWAFKAAYTKMTFEPTRAYYDVVIGVKMPVTTVEGERTQWVGLYAQDIPDCVAGETTWRAAVRYLEDNTFGVPAMDGWDFSIKRSTGNDPNRALRRGDGTALIFSNRGFEQLHIEVGMRIPRNILVPQQQQERNGPWTDFPEGPNGRVQMTGVFDIMRAGEAAPDGGTPQSGQQGGGFYFITDLPRCRIANTEFALTARDVTIDLSDSWSPQADATTSYSIPGLGVNPIPTQSNTTSPEQTWKGLFIREAALQIPGFDVPLGVKNVFTGSPISFTAYAALSRHEVAITENFTVRIDTVDFRIERGVFRSARIMTSMAFPGALEGRIGLDFVYQQIPEGTTGRQRQAFRINLNAREDEHFRITEFMAFTIRRGSQMEVSYTDRPVAGRSRFGFSFDISGGMRLMKLNGRDTVININAIEFEHLKFATDGKGLRAPTITSLFGIRSGSSSGSSGAGGTQSGGSSSSGTGSTSNTARQKVAEFPVTLSSFAVNFGGGAGQPSGSEGSTSLRISAGVTVALTGEPRPGQTGGPTFGGSIGLTLAGTLGISPLQWTATTLSLDSLEINFRSDALTIEGDIQFFDRDPVMGTGFGGSLRVAMAKMFDAQAMLKFGALPTYRYWFVQGSLSLPAGIPIGPVGIYGFIGGAYQHMRAIETRTDEGVVTGIRYEPTDQNTFGIMAGVHLGLLASPKTFHAKVLLTARFHNSNLTNIALDGKGWFMCEFPRGECNGPNNSWVNAHIGFDFDANRFHATLAGQLVMDPLIRINAPEGSVDILFEPHNWHVYIGRGTFRHPGNNPIAATFFPRYFNVGAQAYFMAGNNLDNVAIGGIPLRGGGFATGVRVSWSASGRFLIFFGEFSGHIQAELAVLTVDPRTATCGITGSDGWYALGEVSASLRLLLGMEIDLFGWRERVTIVDGNAELAILIGGPQPTFADASANGSWQLLNGALQGRFHFILHVGDETPSECLTELVNSQVQIPEPIVSFSPPDQSTGQSVFTTVGLGFALPERREFWLRRRDDSVRVRFRLEPILDIRSESEGTLTTGQMTIAEDGLSAEWRCSAGRLDPRTTYRVNAVAIVEKFESSAWVETRRFTKNWSFTTGELPQDLYDDRNNLISCTYPLELQRYSYIEGHERKHYVRLKADVDYLFTNLPAGQTLVAEYTNQRREKREVPVRYEAFQGACGAYLIIEDPPVTANTIYHVRIMKKIPIARKSGSPNVKVTSDTRRITENRSSTPQQNLSFQSGGESVNTSQRSGGYTLERTESVASSRVLRGNGFIYRLMYDWYFGVGAYATPQEKLDTYSLRYNFRAGDFVSACLLGAEPIDDDLTATVFLTSPTSNEGTSRTWVNFLSANDAIARQRSVLESNVDLRDVNLAARYCITTRDRNSYNNGKTYVDGSASWSFNRNNFERHQLQPNEMDFEQVTSFAIRNVQGVPPGFPPTEGVGIGVYSGSTSSRSRPQNSAASACESEIMLDPYNARMDLQAASYRYRNALTRPGNNILGRNFSSTASARTKNYLTNIGNRNWQRMPAGNYAVGLVFKSFNWLKQSHGISFGRSDAERMRHDYFFLDQLGQYGRIGFGEVSCGDIGRFPFIIFPLRIP